MACDRERRPREEVAVQSVGGFRPVAINVGVKDLEEAISFYETVFAVEMETQESGGRPVHARWQFGDGDSFLLFNLRERGPEDPHREHVSAFGFVVDELDATHRRAIAAGAQEHFAPVDEEGLPRHSRFEDSSGNRVVLWQA
jgi:predicted enzyme related to lactoylglutathione lyase